MKAMILAAGLGTRLRPLTDAVPKALMLVNGVPLLEIVIQRLKLYGFYEIIINTHYLAEQISAFLEQRRNFGIDLRISHEIGQLLDTGGGLKQAAWFFDDKQPFLMHNVDILSDVDLQQLYDAHRRSAALATLAVSNRPSARAFLFNRANLLCGWQNTAVGARRITRPTPDADLTPLAFSGIQVINPAIFALMPALAAFSLTELYLHLAAAHQLGAFRHDGGLWLDVGKKDHLAQAGALLSRLG